MQQSKCSTQLRNVLLRESRPGALGYLPSGPPKSRVWSRWTKPKAEGTRALNKIPRKSFQGLGEGW
ncbi:unnamed protein product, partial [Nesidiocoris tenuis]